MDSPEPEQKPETQETPKPFTARDLQDAVDSYVEFTRGPGYDPCPLRRYTRAHGGHCSGGAGPS